MKYTVEQRIYLVECYLLRKNHRRRVRRFSRKYPDCTIPTESCLSKLMKKWHTTGSVCDIPRKRERHVLTVEKLEDIRVRLEISPRKSLKRLAQETDISKGSAHKATRLLKFRPYKQLFVQELKQADFAARIRFCNWFLGSVHDGNLDPQLMFMSDEAWFHLSGHVNSQNVRMWSTENPHIVQEVPLHPIKIGVWCAVSARRIIGPVFFEGRVNSDFYVRTMLRPFLNELTQEEKDYGYFQQDGATAHTAHNSIATLHEVYDDRIISTGLWPPRSADLTYCDYYLWGYLKGKVYRNNPHTLEELKAQITRAVQCITEAELQKVSNNLFKRCEACLTADGGHFQQYLK